EVGSPEPNVVRGRPKSTSIARLFAKSIEPVVLSSARTQPSQRLHMTVISEKRADAQDFGRRVERLFVLELPVSRNRETVAGDPVHRAREILRGYRHRD